MYCRRPLRRTCLGGRGARLRLWFGGRLWPGALDHAHHFFELAAFVLMAAVIGSSSSSDGGSCKGRMQ